MSCTLSPITFSVMGVGVLGVGVLGVGVLGVGVLGPRHLLTSLFWDTKFTLWINKCIILNSLLGKISFRNYLQQIMSTNLLSIDYLAKYHIQFF